MDAHDAREERLPASHEAERYRRDHFIDSLRPDRGDDGKVQCECWSRSTGSVWTRRCRSRSLLVGLRTAQAISAKYIIGHRKVSICIPVSVCVCKWVGCEIDTEYVYWFYVELAGPGKRSLCAYSWVYRSRVWSWTRMSQTPTLMETRVYLAALSDLTGR